MNEIIVALLFLYPGGLIDIFLNANKSATYSTHEMDNISRTALCFAYSVVSTFIAILVFGGIMLRRVDLAATLALLNTWSGLLVYALISLIAIAPATGIIWFADSFWQRLYCKYREWKYKGKHSSIQTVWQSITKEDLCYALRIRSADGHIIEQGYIRHLPTDLRKDKGILLEYPRAIKETFDKEEAREYYFPYCEFVYFDSETGYLYEFYDATKYLEAQDKMLTSSGAGAELEDGSTLMDC